MTEDRRGEIALLLIEALPFTEGINPNDIESLEDILKGVTNDMEVSVEDLESLVRPAYDRLLNRMFPSTAREVFLRRDPEAKKIAIKFFVIAAEQHNSSLNLFHELKNEQIQAGIPELEMKEWTNTFF